MWYAFVVSHPSVTNCSSLWLYQLSNPSLGRVITSATWMIAYHPPPLSCKIGDSIPQTRCSKSHILYSCSRVGALTDLVLAEKSPVILTHCATVWVAHLCICEFVCVCMFVCVWDMTFNRWEREQDQKTGRGVVRRRFTFMSDKTSHIKTDIGLWNNLIDCLHYRHVVFECKHLSVCISLSLPIYFVCVCLWV